MNLSGKTALITGANSGIGKAIALAFGKAGADVAINYIDKPELADEVCKEIKKMGRRAIAIEADISDPEQVRKMVSQTVAYLGQIDILVNNAGMQIKKAFIELTPEDWDKMISVDLKGLFLTTLYSAKEMVKQKSGKIINITSVHQMLPKPGFAPYCAAKAGAGMLTEVLANELAEHNIRVNAIAPGAIDTPMNQNLMQSPQLLKMTLDEIPLKKIGKPEEVASLAVYLASSLADYITGATFVIDGGLIVRGAKY